jgi:glycosyltransferase involved in cell wall biosynthesis
MSKRLTLDIIIPSYNRAELLKRTLASIARADPSPSLDVGILVVDNNSTDATRAVVEAAMPQFGGRLSYLLEPQQGRSYALNAGIRASRADIIGMIDDDEEIDGRWLVEIGRRFADEALDFLGGPCLPSWGGQACPAWLPSSHRGLIGWIVPAEEPFDYGDGTSAYMVGGNSVIRRRVLEEIGLYSTSLGRTGAAVNGGEDLELCGRLLAAGKRGKYSPDLIIYHHIPKDRLVTSFFRRRSFWDGVSIGFVSRRRPEPVPHIAGVPRYFMRMAAEGLLDRLSPTPRKPSVRFAGELLCLELLGRFYGRHFYAGPPAR